MTARYTNGLSLSSVAAVTSVGMVMNGTCRARLFRKTSRSSSESVGFVTVDIGGITAIGWNRRSLTISTGGSCDATTSSGGVLPEVDWVKTGLSPLSEEGFEAPSTETKESSFASSSAIRSAWARGLQWSQYRSRANARIPQTHVAFPTFL